MLSPALAAFYILFHFYSREERHNYWLMVLDYKRISLKLLGLVLIFPILVKYSAAIMAADFSWDRIQFSIAPEMTLSYAFFLLFFGPITEELGWRGVALPELVKRYGFTIATIFLGLMWALWHLPLFFIKGSYHYQLGLGGPAFWNYMLSIISISILYGAVYYKANQSILIVILFHYLDNLAGETFQISFNARIWESIFRTVIALVVLLYKK